MKVITAPEIFEIDKIEGPTVFLAGGITNGPWWQDEVITALDEFPGTIFNPRRRDFPIGDPDASVEQIEWEWRVLRQVDLVQLWFPCETICPIVLYELGAALERDQQVVVGIHPEYSRRQDVEIQSGLMGTQVIVGFEDFIEKLKAEIGWLADVANATKT